MDYQELKEYVGKKRACEGCGRAFTQGEVIIFDANSDAVVCYSDSGGGCVTSYVVKTRKPFGGSPMRFGGSSEAQPENPMPAYSAMPMHPVTPRAQPRPSLLDRIKRAFKLS